MNQLYGVDDVRYGFSESQFREYLKDNRCIIHVKLSPMVSYCRQAIRRSQMLDSDLQADPVPIRVCRRCMEAWIKKNQRSTVRANLPTQMGIIPFKD